MSGPSVTVQRAPDGWTHIGGPGMHLLIALDEEDDRTLTASDAADGGDLDDVIDVLTTGGMRRAHHFVGVHWQPRTRIVAFGPVTARVVLADGSERDVRAQSSRVWTNVEFDEHPQSVMLEVIGDAGEPGAPAQSATDGQPAEDRAHEPVSSASPAEAAPARMAPTFAPAPAPERSTTSAGSWGRSWQRPEPAPPVAPEAPAAPSLPAWGSGRPVAARHQSQVPPDRAPLPPPRPEAQERDVHSTWAGYQAPTEEHRDQPGTSGQPGTSAQPGTSRQPGTSGQPGTSAQPGTMGQPILAGTGSRDEPEADDAEQPALVAPSYDYLFGHTTTVEEQRRLLAASDDGDSGDDDAGDEPTEDGPALTGAWGATGPQADPETTEPGTTALGTSALGTAAPTPAQPTPARPASGTPHAAPAPSGGLISSVPWATPATEPASPAPAPAFTGRHTPPAAPTLLPSAPAAPTLLPPAAPAAPTLLPPAAPAATPRAPTAQQPEPAPSIAAEPDDAELTVDRSALLAARNAALEGGTGPRVMAVLCASGHPSPPHANQCRICGGVIPAQDSFEMPRPTLGILRLSTGDIVTLDRNVLLGRAPKPADGLPPEEQPHVVKVPSPERDISRNHVEVLVEGWHVLIRDLGTTNGTTVALPGEGSVRMRANDQQSLEPGSVVTMADDVSFTYEVGS